MLTYFRPPEEVALYQVASPTAKLLLYFAEAVSVVLFPIAAELHYRNRLGDLRKGLSAAWKYSLVVIVPLAFVLAAAPGPYLRLLFGPTYAGAADALRLLALGAIFYAIAFINNSVLTAVGQPGASTRVIAIGAALNLALNLALVGPFAILGVVAATLASYVYILIHSTIKIRRALGAANPFPDAAKIVGCGAAWLLVFVAFERTALPFLVRQALAAATGGLVYLGLLFATRILSRQEFRDMLALARRRGPDAVPPEGLPP